MDLTEDASEDGTSTLTEEEAGTIPPQPTDNEASMTPPAPTGKMASTTPEKPTDSKQKGTQYPAVLPLPAAKVAVPMTTTLRLKTR